MLRPLNLDTLIETCHQMCFAVVGVVIIIKKMAPHIQLSSELCVIYPSLRHATKRKWSNKKTQWLMFQDFWWVF